MYHQISATMYHLFSPIMYHPVKSKNSFEKQKVPHLFKLIVPVPPPLLGVDGLEHENSLPG